MGAVTGDGYTGVVLSHSRDAPDSLLPLALA
jgi:hypothetical protein